MIHVGIVGHEAAKFTPATEAAAREIIRKLLEPPDVVVVSGHCHLGGIDIWAEEIAKELGAYDPELIFPPKKLQWAGGYKDRNILIARNSDIVHCIAVAELPPGYTGMRFEGCYHCNTSGHVKSGGCWTAKYAQRLGKQAKWHVI